MSTKAVEILPEEVRATAYHPWHRLLGFGAAIAFGFALFLGLLRPPPPLEPSPPLAVHTCAVSAPPEPCMALLDPELRAIPTPPQYALWRLHDVLQTTPGAPRRLPPNLSEKRAGRTLLELSEKWRIEGQVQEVLRQDAWLMRPAREVREQLLALGTERDWSAVPPLPSRDVIVASGHGNTYDIAVEKIDGLLPLLEEHRDRMLEEVWVEIVRREQERHREADLAYNAAVRARAWPLYAGLLAVLLSVGWVSTRPRSVSVGVHRLRFGRRSFRWTEIDALQWTPQPLVRTRRGTFLLGMRHCLPPDAIAALTDAAEMARQRAAKLDPVDREALSAVRDLGR